MLPYLFLLCLTQLLLLILSDFRAAKRRIKLAEPQTAKNELQELTGEGMTEMARVDVECIPL